MTGDNVTENRFEPWEEETNKVIANNLIENIEKLLGGKAKHFYVSDRTTQHEKIVIEFNHKQK